MFTSGMKWIVIVAVAGVIFAGTRDGASADPSGWTSAEGRVLLIKRECTFNVTETNTLTGKRKHSVEEDSCSATDEFAEMRNDKDRKRNIAGEARVSVEYKGADGSTEVAAFEVTGRDDAFYELRKGDTVDLLVSKTDPQTVKLK